VRMSPTYLPRRSGESRFAPAQYYYGKIGAELRDGVLSLTLPKVEEAKPRTIQIK
jgi:HSP20 family molecular chaperone IbpA